MSMPTNKEINVPYKTNTVEKYPYIVYAEIENKLKFLEGSIDELESSLPSTAFTDTNTVKKYIDDAITNVNTELAQRAICFDTVADMAAATDLAVDMICHTNGFHTSGDGGAAFYEIKSTGTANAMDIIACQDSLLAHLVVENEVLLEQFGFTGDANTFNYVVTNYDNVTCNIDISTNESLTIDTEATYTTKNLNITFNGNYTYTGNTQAFTFKGRFINFKFNNITSSAKGIVIQPSTIDCLNNSFVGKMILSNDHGIVIDSSNKAVFLNIFNIEEIRYKWRYSSSTYESDTYGVYIHVDSGGGSNLYVNENVFNIKCIINFYYAIYGENESQNIIYMRRNIFNDTSFESNNTALKAYYAAFIINEPRIEEYTDAKPPFILDGEMNIVVNVPELNFPLTYIQFGANANISANTNGIRIKCKSFSKDRWAAVYECNEINAYRRMPKQLIPKMFSNNTISLLDETYAGLMTIAGKTNRGLINNVISLDGSDGSAKTGYLTTNPYNPYGINEVVIYKTGTDTWTLKNENNVSLATFTDVGVYKLLFVDNAILSGNMFVYNCKPNGTASIAYNVSYIVS